MNEARLLIIEDNDEIAQMLALFLGSRNYKVSIASDGATALQMVREFLPNLILLDVGLPDTDGYELLKQFRQNVRTRYIPAIFLTQRSKKADRITGLQLGADDFITKPFDLEELFLRVQNAVVRSERENLSDPNTGLPAGRVAREEVTSAKARADRVAIEFRLQNTSEFRDLYGALANSDLLRYTALMMNRVLNSVGAPEDFIGQTAEETFVIVSTPERAELIRKAVIERFNNDVVQHYSLGERLGHQVKVKDPSGQERILPLIKLEATHLG
jgi:DNA-binding response OmpR family regulator